MAVRKTIGSSLVPENDRKVFHQILQTGPPNLSVPPGLPETDDVSMVWLCHRSYEAMPEVRPRLYRGHSYDQPTKTYPARQGGMFEISKKRLSSLMFIIFSFFFYFHILSNSQKWSGVLQIRKSKTITTSTNINEFALSLVLLTRILDILDTNL